MVEIVSTDDYVSFWKAKNGCEVKQDKVDLPNTADDGTTVSVIKYSDCKEEGALVLYTINNGGHTWPGGNNIWENGGLGRRIAISLPVMLFGIFLNLCQILSSSSYL